MFLSITLFLQNWMWGMRLCKWNIGNYDGTQKCCYDHIEFGLCECRFDTLEMLELHLVTCNVYECGQCFMRVKNLTGMKKHVKTEHKDGKCLHHLKIDRIDGNKIR